MIKQFIENLKKTELYTNHKLQINILVAGTVVGLAMKIMPQAAKENLITIMICGIAICGPIAILAIYDGLINDA